MFQTVLDPGAVAAPVFRDLYVRAYRLMLMARMVDEKMASLYRAGKIHGGVFIGRGQESVSVALGIALRKGDIFGPSIRDGAGRLAFGEPILDAIRTYMGSPLGPMRARDGNIHRGRPKEGLLAMISHLGTTLAVVNGMLFARRMRGVSGIVGAACLGDGATSTGASHEALNQAAVEKLPLVVVVANNRYAYSTPNERQFACRSLVDRAIGYGFEGCVVDGTDLEACLKVIGNAVERARAGRGPQMVVAELLRLCGHGEHDDAGYIDSKLKLETCGRDCLKVAEQELQCRNWVNAETLSVWRNEVAQSIEEVIAQVQREPGPDPFSESWRALATESLAEGYE